MNNNLSYQAFRKSIDEEIQESDKYDQQKKAEKELLAEINEITTRHKKLQNEYSNEQKENAQEVANLKRTVNEVQVEKELHLQYLERQIEGEYSMHNRKYRKKQQALQEIIDKYNKALQTEKEVTAAVTSHLEVKTSEINAARKQRDDLKDAKQAQLEEERDNIMNMKAEAKQQYEHIMGLIQQDNEDRKAQEEEERKAQAEEEAKKQQKIAMDDAARYL